MPRPAIVLIVLLLEACSESSSPAPTLAVLNGEHDDLASVAVASVQPEALRNLAGHSQLIAPIPEVLDSRVMADSGLQVAYTRLNQWLLAPAESIEEHWLHMQACLSQVAPAPLILVVTGQLRPLTRSDEVVFHFDQPIASATIDSVTVLQISESDLTGVHDNSGFYLKSIIGRYLWSSANLAVHDYPYGCASQ